MTRFQTALGALSSFRRHCSPAVIPAQAGIQTVEQRQYSKAV
ncbi:hypothetical protein NEIPOLOT_02451 [Neisseria polysaccharea ATCC 43768]|nr:hypothetical protein [Neisseria polysaccharea]EFH21823.1 hypothetical protein NEIPOLOT_02451 [Neisseria polysaccharea ATCC 43768]